VLSRCFLGAYCPLWMAWNLELALEPFQYASSLLGYGFIMASRRSTIPPLYTARFPWSLDRKEQDQQLRRFDDHFASSALSVSVSLRGRKIIRIESYIENAERGLRYCKCLIREREKLRCLRTLEICSCSRECCAKIAPKCLCSR